jgi:hypothetical protein
MRRVRVLLMALSSASGAGCFSASTSAPDSFVCLATRNTVQAPIRDHDEVHFIKLVHKYAEKSWTQLCKANPQHFSDAYHNGFVEGFVDYVQAGGSGEPPYLPPFRYRLSPYRTPEGLSLVDDWYAGFRHGSAIAKESGLRELNLVPLPAYAVPKDLNAVDTSETIKPASSNPKAPNEGSPWGDQRKILPIPRSIPEAPQAPPAPFPAGFLNLPSRPTIVIEQQQYPGTIPSHPLLRFTDNFIRPASVPPYLGDDIWRLIPPSDPSSVTDPK